MGETTDDDDDDDIYYDEVSVCVFVTNNHSRGWGPPIGGCKSFWKVLRTEMTN